MNYFKLMHKSVVLQKIKQIHALFEKGILFEPVNGRECKYIAIYYNFIKKDYENTEKYYLMAIERGNISGAKRLASYYKHVKFDYKNAKKYYTMAIKHGKSKAMIGMAFYYELIKKNNTKAIHYYSMAIDHGKISAKFNLGFCYHNMKDYANMEKYYLMAIQHGYYKAIINLGYYYYHVKKNSCADNYFMMIINNANYKDKIFYVINFLLYHEDYANVEKYLLMAIECTNIGNKYYGNAMLCLANYYEKKRISLIQKNIFLWR